MDAEPQFVPLVEFFRTLIIGFFPYILISMGPCPDISGKAPLLHAIALSARYLPTLCTPVTSAWITAAKSMQLSAIFITVIIVFVFSRSYDYKSDDFLSELLILFAIVLTVLIPFHRGSFQVLWQFSQYLEAVAYIPQMYLIYKKQVYSGTASFLIGFMSICKFIQIWYWLTQLPDKDTQTYFYITHIPAVAHFAIYLIFLMLPQCLSTGKNKEDVDSDRTPLISEKTKV